MIEQLKTMHLESMAETAREIVEDGKENDDFSNIDAQQLNKLRIKSTIPHDKRFQIAKIKAFKKAISEFGK